jgi:glycosyltransferase involved in cell wall biosynthesis
MRLHNETILILANAEWDWTNRVNCHHIAARLARNNRVLFVDTVGGRAPAPREFGKIVRRLRRIAGGVRKISDGLTVLAPFVVPIYGNTAIRHLNTALWAWQIRRALPKGARPILWIFLPWLVGLVGRLDEKLVIYHCVDIHVANPNASARQVIESERQLLKVADIVFATSSTLYEEKRAFNPNTFYLPNVADANHFARARDAALPIADDLRDMPHPIAGFVGNITAYKLDFDLLRVVAQRRHNWSFVLVGPIGRGDPSTSIARLQGLENVHPLGERPYSELPRYVKAFDACLIPFNQNESTRGSLPMKFFEYLAAGKPVIATDLPTLAEFRDFFYPVHDAEEFAAALDATVGEDVARVAARVAIAQKYSWDARMGEIEKIVQGAFEGFDPSRYNSIVR